MPVIRKVFQLHQRRYGARRLTKDLVADGYTVGPRRVARLMKEMNLVAIQPKSYKPKTTQSRHALGYSPNHLNEADFPSDINQTWVGDITYIPLRNGHFAYLAVLMDLYSRRLVGWALRDSMKESLVIAVLQQAIKNRRPPVGVIHHTDRGGQYASKAYRTILKRNKFLAKYDRRRLQSGEQLHGILLRHDQDGVRNV